jgi:hypothetical protein
VVPRGTVAGVCQDIGLVAYLDALAGPSRQQASLGTVTVAKILNGSEFSNRQLYLVSQFFAIKSMEHLLGAGITAEQLHNDCLGRTQDLCLCVEGSPVLDSPWSLRVNE